MALKENNQDNHSLNTTDLIELLSKKTIELLDAMSNKTDGLKIQTLRQEVTKIQEAVKRSKQKD